ncbi:hypothetical protein MMC13_004303 [Lambiella insularis]|nr:hypothetical protein [Lambiella insularis]
MSTSVASSWFLPDEEFEVVTSDYVFCKRTAAVIQLELDVIDKMEFPCKNVEPNFCAQMEVLSRVFFHARSGGGLLIYSDAHKEEPNRWQAALQKRSKEPLRESLPDELEEVEQRMIECMRDEEDYPPESEGGPPDPYFRMMFNRQAPDARDAQMSPAFLDLLISAETTRVQGNMLTICSGQSHTLHPRPVMLLIGAIINLWATDGKRKTGLAYAYDFAKRTVIIKPFSYEGGQHPLRKSWFEKSTKDKAYTCQRVEDFVKSDLKAGARDPFTPEMSILLWAKYQVGAWLTHHTDALDIPEEDVEALEKQLDTLRADLVATDFPALKDRSIPCPERFYIINGLRCGLQCQEGVMREVAVAAKKDGQDVLADNMVKYFERCVNGLKQIAERPDMPLK